MANPQSGDWEQFWKTTNHYTAPKISWSKKRVLDVIKPYVVAGKNALDAGCGSGFFAKHFYDAAMATTALDYSPKALEITRQLTGGRVKIIQEDLLKPHLSSRISERFDLIFSDGLFEHFLPGEQDVIMKNFISLLNPNGVVVTFVPNRFSPWEIIRPFFMPGIDETPFVPRGLASLNERNGLKILGSGGVNVLPFFVSPEKFLGKYFGMLLYTISCRNV
ncbi:MAG: class I SAM-dependent methyltransferase [Candidatus Omnitrophota bacterium]